MSRHVLCSALVVATLTLTACVQTQDEHSPPAQAIADLRARAEAGDAGAQFILGGMYVIGDSVPPDAAAAVAWYRRAAEQGHARAQYNLGVMYERGDGVPPDAAAAVAWYRRAAEQGHAAAQSNLGAMYAEGRGVPPDAAAAVAWYRRAAEQGDATAQTNLGAMYEQGLGVPPDAAAAVAWYRRAAEQGHARAQYNLGGLYREGRGVPPDAAAAVAWYRRAAEQGHARAQYNLGGLYAEGRGVPPDAVEALMWFTIAAARSTVAEREPIVTVRAALAVRMTPTDVREAERRAQAWLAANQGIIRGRVDPRTVINSDGWRGYHGLVDLVDHDPRGMRQHALPSVHACEGGMQAILMTRLDEAQKTPDLLTRHDALPAARRARRFTGSRTVKRNVRGEGTARRGRPVALGIAAAGQPHARGPRAGATPTTTFRVFLPNPMVS